MATQSKRSQLRMQQSGRSGRLRVVHRMPRLAWRLPHAPFLNAATEFRLRCLEQAHWISVADAVRVFRRSRARVYRWRTRYDPIDLWNLRSRSHRQQWTPAQEQAVLGLRQRHRRSGKAKLVYLLRAQ